MIIIQSRAELIRRFKEMSDKRVYIEGVTNNSYKLANKIIEWSNNTDGITIEFENGIMAGIEMNNYDVSYNDVGDVINFNRRVSGGRMLKTGAKQVAHTRKIHTGPKGGKYYVKSGRKVYC